MRCDGRCRLVVSIEALMNFNPSQPWSSFAEGRGAAEGFLEYGDANQIGSAD